MRYYNNRIAQKIFGQTVRRQSYTRRADELFPEKEDIIQNPHNTDGGVTRLRMNKLDGAGAEVDFAADVRRGLTARRKFLPPKYFYDDLGSQLFETICLLPEYYLTRAESEIFARRCEEIIEAASDGALITLVELGSGSASKTRRVIEALLARQSRLLYIPVDISTAALEASAHALLQDYASLAVNAYAGDYDAALPLVGAELVEGARRALVLFLGSNVGNFDRDGARDFLRRVRGVLRAGDRLLLGADLKKDPAVLEAAYDDALGVTAAFNLNLLARINRELEADFDLRAFRHVALYNPTEGRVEMHVESERAQAVSIHALELEIHFDAGERIHTENSYKYDLAELSALADATGFARERTWLDAGERFSSNLFIAH